MVLRSDKTGDFLLCLGHDRGRMSTLSACRVRGGQAAERCARVPLDNPCVCAQPNPAGEPM